MISSYQKKKNHLFERVRGLRSWGDRLEGGETPKGCLATFSLEKGEKREIKKKKKIVAITKKPRETTADQSSHAGNFLSWKIVKLSRKKIPFSLPSKKKKALKKKTKKRGRSVPGEEVFQ